MIIIICKIIIKLKQILLILVKIELGVDFLALKRQISLQENRQITRKKITKFF